MTEILEYLKTNQEAYTVVGILLTLLFSLISLWFTVRNNKAVQYMDSVTKNRVEWISSLRKKCFGINSAFGYSRFNGWH